MTNDNEVNTGAGTKSGTETNSWREPPPTARRFQHEGLAAYAFAREATRFILSRRSQLRGLPGEAGPQLERAVVGAQTNLCSGASHFGAEAKRHFRIALSEANEAGGALDIAYDAGAFDHAEYTECRRILLRLCATIGGLAK